MWDAQKDVALFQTKGECNYSFFVEGMKLRCFFSHIWGYNTTENKKRNLLVINDCKILC